MKKAQILFCKKAYKDFRIFDEKAGLRRLLRGDKTRVSIAQAKGKLPALSQKDKSH